MARKPELPGVNGIEWTKPVAHLGDRYYSHGKEGDATPIFLSSGTGWFRTTIKGDEFEQADEKGLVHVEAESLAGLLAKIGSLAKKRPRLDLPVTFVDKPHDGHEGEAIGKTVILTGIDGRTGTVRFQERPTAKPEAAYNNPDWLIPVGAKDVIDELAELARRIEAARKVVTSLMDEFEEKADAAGVGPQHMSSADARQLMEAETALAAALKAKGAKPLGTKAKPKMKVRPKA